MKFIFLLKRPAPPLFKTEEDETHAYLGKDLAYLGHEIEFISIVKSEDFCRWVKIYNKFNYLKQPIDFIEKNNIISYCYQGIKCVLLKENYFDDNLKKIIVQFKGADFVICALEKSSEYISVLKKNNIKTIGWLHSFTPDGMDPVYAQPDLLMSTSNFIFERARRFTRKIPNLVLYPGFDFKEPLKKTGQFLTFFDPLKEKGGGFILKLAPYLPKEKFLCIEGEKENTLFRSCLFENMSYKRIKKIDTFLSKTKILLVPSIQEEGFSRLIIEAQMRGIPVIAHDTGGLSEALNSGGTLMKNLSVFEWKNTILRYSSEAFYQEERKKARLASLKFKQDVGKMLIEFLSHY